MKISRHIAASAALGAAVYAAGFPPRAAASAVAAGIFIDVDHLLDYFISEKRVRLDVKDFFHKCENHLLKSAYLFGHSYELVPILAAGAYFFSSAVLWGALAGFSLHLFMDAAHKAGIYPNKPLGYFFIYRFFFLKERFYEKYK